MAEIDRILSRTLIFSVLSAVYTTLRGMQLGLPWEEIRWGVVWATWITGVGYLVIAALLYWVDKRSRNRHAR